MWIIIVSVSVGSVVLVVVVYLLANPQRAEGLVNVIRAIGGAFGRGGEKESKVIVVESRTRAQVADVTATAKSNKNPLVAKRAT